MIYWTFGASAVGKKTFMRAAVKEPERFGLPARLTIFGFEDGEVGVDTLLSTHGAETAATFRTPLIVRWQWDREKILKRIAIERPDIDQCILLCRVYPSVHVARVIEREGSLIWPEPALIREALDVELLVQKLSMMHGLFVRYIDTTTDDYVLKPEPEEP